MNGNPKFSIIIPVYNVENYLSRCLDSVVNQTLLDIEIICVNDGSKDNSDRILKQYANLDDRIKIIEKENGGLSSARNAGMKIARGDYICFLDSDDYVEKFFCERLYKEVLENNPDIIVFGANIFPLTKDTEFWIYKSLSPITHKFRRFSSAILLSDNRGYPFVWRNCFKRNYLHQKRLQFNEDIKFGEDTVFQLCAFPGAKNIIYISDKLYNYRYDRKNSLMFKFRRDDTKRLYEHLEIIDKIAEYWERAGYLPRWDYLFAAFVLDFMGYDLAQYKLDDKKNIVEKLFKILHRYGVELKWLNTPHQYRKYYWNIRMSVRKK